MRGESDILLATGQRQCFDAGGRTIDCRGSGQDGELRKGVAWPFPRFEICGNVALDRLTGLNWRLEANLGETLVSWSEALALVERLNRIEVAAWRLPNINELESLVDCATHSPALPLNHPFAGVKTGYWSSTTSFFETDWAWALYLDKGAIGVGQKRGRHFHVWPVR